MSAAAPSLRRLQQLFRDLGINDDVQIAGHVASLLLAHDQWNELLTMRDFDLVARLVEILRNRQKEHPRLQNLPEPPMIRRATEGALRLMIGLLAEAYGQSPHNLSPGRFFQREVRFELLKSTRGGQYPTPHHLATFMASLAISGVSVEVIDLATGSGGLLAAAYELDRSVNSINGTGIDYDPVWSELGTVNLLLHDRNGSATFLVGSALEYRDSQRAGFDAVLLNPPFSGGRNKGEVWDALHTEEFGTSTPNVLSAKSLQLLRPWGRAALLLPSGVLFGGGANTRLRALFARHRLEAIVTLDKECFQPFSNVTAHLVSVQKLPDDAPASATPVWMCNVAGDGYAAGAGRDLTDDPVPKVNELPRVRELVIQTRQATWPHVLDVPGSTQVEAILLRPTDGLAGAAVRRSSATDQIDWQITDIPSGALVHVHGDQQTLCGVVHLPFRASTNAAIATLSPEANAQVSWRDLLSTNAWADTLPARWTGTTDAITLTVQDTGDARTLDLKAGTRKSQINASFASAGPPSPLACILDGDGQPLSPWLSSQDDESMMDDKTGERLQAWAVMDAHNERCGWLLALTEVQTPLDGGENEQGDPRTGWLLITEPTPARFITAGADHWALLLQSLDNSGQRGWLHGDLNNTNCVQIEFGELVVLCSDFQAQGFAIGPAPEPGSPAATVFGVLVPHEHLVPADGEPLTFEPRTYLPEPPPAAVSHPSDVIARIRKNQARLGLRVDNLLQMIGGVKTPSDTGGVLPPDYLHSALLDERQCQVWEVIQKINTADGYPRRFTLGELRKECQAANVAQSDTQLDQAVVLFLRLGIVVEVHTSQHNGYRCVSAADIVPPEAVSHEA